MLIKDLVSIDEKAEFRNDVQLSDYDVAPRNLALLRSYLFTAIAPNNLEPSLVLLRATINSFLTPKVGNRIVTIANFGHGKSHLALVMANYFSKPFNSEEMKVIQDKIRQAVATPPQASLYRDFRQSHPEFLVIRLRGDVPRSLREQFIIGLEHAFQEHQVTRDVRVPYWHRKAEELLQNLSADQRIKADQFLEEYNIDVIGLLDDVSKVHDSAYDLCRALFTKLHGVPPDLGGEVSLREVINWVAGKYCGEGKPLGGIFVLFDEFSLYIQRHAQRSAAGELQDLLNGIEDQEGRAVFMAFAQHDPKTVAQNVMKGTQGLDSLTKELTRITRTYFLFSLMESVIDSYLIQPEGKWCDFRGDPLSRGPLARASNLTMDLFSKRYEDALHWEPEKFDEIVTKGCFPLHPLTTALLCDLKLQGIAAQVGNPRTVLGFVFEQINIRNDLPAVTDTGINWVLPIHLVEYFGNYLPESVYAIYENAQGNLSPDAPPQQLALLQALLLQEAAHLPVRRDSQIQFLIEAAGISTIDQGRHHLKQMTEADCIRFDPDKKINSFWPVRVDHHRLEELLQKRLEGKQYTWELIADLNNEQTKPIGVDIAWGHSDDWAAVEKILTMDFFDVKHLTEFISLYKVSSSGELQEGTRGCVIWLLAQNEDEVTWFRQNAANVLDEAFPGDNPPPIILMLPTRPCPELLEAFQKKKEMDKFTTEDRKEVGGEMYEHEKSHLFEAVNNGVGALRGDLQLYTSIPRNSNSWVAPAPYRAALQALGKVSLYQILKECYRFAYRYSPPEFFTQYRLGGKGPNKLGEATRLVASVLLRNSLGSNREAVSTNPIARDLCEKFLWQRWHLISADYRIQEPGNQRVLAGWKVLEQAFPGGAKDFRVREALLSLLNPSHGYDYNTATLLLCAWTGFHMHELQVSMQGQLTTLEGLAGVLAGGGKVFIHKICCYQPLTFSRRDQGQIIREVKDLISSANRDIFAQLAAKEAIAKLQSFCTDQGLQPELCESASQAAGNLINALCLAEKYDKEASEISEKTQNERNLGDIISLQNKIADLPRLGNVTQTFPSPAQLDLDWRTRLESLVESECRKLENIQRIAQIDWHQKQLDDLKKQLKKAKLNDLVKRVETASDVIATKSADLETQEREKPVQVEINGMDAKAQLITLYEYLERLKAMDGYSTGTMQMCKERWEAIEREITQLEVFATGLIGAAEGLESLTQINSWQNQYLRQLSRYAETQFHHDLETSGERVRHIQVFIEELDPVARRFPANYQEAVLVINKLDQMYAIPNNWLGAVHKQLVIETKEKIVAHVQEQVNQARRWYTTLEDDFGNGVISKVVEKIKNPHPFLPDIDKPKLDTLQKRIQQRLDDDVVTRIETQFRQITDPAICRQCLTLLQQIMDEKQS